MALSGLKRDLTVVLLTGGLLAAACVFPGKAQSLPVSMVADSVHHPAGISVAHYKKNSSQQEQGNSSEEKPDNSSKEKSKPTKKKEESASRADATNAQTMIASFYGRELEGSLTASGQPFDADAYTAAHKTLPLGTKLLVSYGGNSVRVTVNDRGPYVPGRDLDLSLAAAQKIGLTGPGTGVVRVVVLS